MFSIFLVLEVNLLVTDAILPERAYNNARHKQLIAHERITTMAAYTSQAAGVDKTKKPIIQQTKHNKQKKLVAE